MWLPEHIAMLGLDDGCAAEDTGYSLAEQRKARQAVGPRAEARKLECRVLCKCRGSRRSHGSRRGRALHSWHRSYGLRSGQRTPARTATACIAPGCRSNRSPVLLHYPPHTVAGSPGTARHSFAPTKPYTPRDTVDRLACAGGECHKRVRPRPRCMCCCCGSRRASPAYIAR